ncbi:MAG: flagellar hook-basal body complex protein FliE, partial [Hyphomicrobiaceae bacterium]|nr:flagellar hook-basal body complex protein FliE [Hyphomicrobiaceae bacterium]
MTTTPYAAANAYAALQRAASAGTEQRPASGADRPDFAALLQDTLGSVVSQGNTMEAQAGGYLQGRSDVVDVVTAVAET